MPDGVGQLGERFIAQIIEPSLQRAGVLRPMLAMLGVAPFVPTLSVVQEREELHHQHVCAASPGDVQRVPPA